MIDQPLVSVLMTSYNRERYIAEAIKSVLDQTYSNFELIITDNASTDSTVEIIQQFLPNEKIRFYQNESNIGQFQNRNYAASLAKGKYLKYVDSDDLIYPNCLEIMVGGMEKFPEAGLGMVWGLKHDTPPPQVHSSLDVYRLYYFKNTWMQVGPSGAIYKKTCFDEVGGFDTLPYVGDFDLNMKLGAKWPVVRLTEKVFYYRTHEGQELAEATRNFKLDGYEIYNYQIQKRYLLSDDCPLNSLERRSALRTMTKMQARRSVSWFFRTKKIKDFIFLVEKSNLGWVGFFKGILSIK